MIELSTFRQLVGGQGLENQYLSVSDNAIKFGNADDVSLSLEGFNAEIDDKAAARNIYVRQQLLEQIRDSLNGRNEDFFKAAEKTLFGDYDGETAIGNLSAQTVKDLLDGLDALGKEGQPKGVETNGETSWDWDDLSDLVQEARMQVSEKELSRVVGRSLKRGTHIDSSGGGVELSGGYRQYNVVDKTGKPVLGAGGKPLTVVVGSSGALYAEKDYTTFFSTCKNRLKLTDAEIPNLLKGMDKSAPGCLHELNVLAGLFYAGSDSLFAVNELSDNSVAGVFIGQMMEKLPKIKSQLKPGADDAAVLKAAWSELKLPGEAPVPSKSDGGKAAGQKLNDAFRRKTVSDFFAAVDVRKWSKRLAKVPWETILCPSLEERTDLDKFEEREALTLDFANDIPYEFQSVLNRFFSLSPVPYEQRLNYLKGDYSHFATEDEYLYSPTTQDRKHVFSPDSTHDAQFKQEFFSIGRYAGFQFNVGDEMAIWPEPGDGKGQVQFLNKFKGFSDQQVWTMLDYVNTSLLTTVQSYVLPQRKKYMSIDVSRDEATGDMIVKCRHRAGKCVGFIGKDRFDSDARIMVEVQNKEISSTFRIKPDGEAGPTSHALTILKDDLEKKTDLVVDQKN